MFVILSLFCDSFMFDSFFSFYIWMILMFVTLSSSHQQRQRPIYNIISRLTWEGTHNSTSSHSSIIIIIICLVNWITFVLVERKKKKNNKEENPTKSLVECMKNKIKNKNRINEGNFSRTKSQKMIQKEKYPSKSVFRGQIKHERKNNPAQPKQIRIK